MSDETDVVGWCHDCGRWQWKSQAVPTDAYEGLPLCVDCGSPWRFAVRQVHPIPALTSPEASLPGVWCPCAKDHANQGVVEFNVMCPNDRMIPTLEIQKEAYEKGVEPVTPASD